MKKRIMEKSELTGSQKVARSVLLAVVFFGVIAVIIVIGGYAAFEIAGREAESYIGKFKPDTGSLDDGIYAGEYESFGTFTTAKVEFVIEGGEVASLSFPVLFRTPGHSAADEVRKRIDDTGDLRFDTVTGATRTSSFAKAAIKDAIETGPMIEYDTELSGIDFR
ncbi:MAG: FMN-binding protein [bacterium]|nr:FMN-binding protein [bacterium]